MAITFSCLVVNLLESKTGAMKEFMMDILIDSSMNYLSVIVMDKKKGT